MNQQNVYRFIDSLFNISIIVGEHNISSEMLNENSSIFKSLNLINNFFLNLSKDKSYSPFKLYFLIGNPHLMCEYEDEQNGFYYVFSCLDNSYFINKIQYKKEGIFLSERNIESFYESYFSDRKTFYNFIFADMKEIKTILTKENFKILMYLIEDLLILYI